MHVCRTMVCALAKYCSTTLHHTSLYGNRAYTRRVYFISPVDPFHRASPRVAGKGSRVIWMPSRLVDLSRFYRLLASKKSSFHRSATILSIPIYSTYCFVIREKRYDSCSPISSWNLTIIATSVLSNRIDFVVSICNIISVISHIFYHFIAKIRRRT